MTKLKNIGTRSLSLLLCLIMVIGLLQLTAFAEEGEDLTAGAGSEVTSPAGEPDPAPRDDDGDGSDSDRSEPREIPASEAPVPDDADVRTSETTEGSTTTTTTDTTWSSETVIPDPNKPGTEAGELGYPDPFQPGVPEKDANGTYKDEGTHESSDSRTDVTVTVEGEQHRTDSTTVDGQNRPIEDSFELNGQQTTTTTETTTTHTTITDVKTTEEDLGTTETKGEDYGETTTDTDFSSPEILNENTVTTTNSIKDNQSHQAAGTPSSVTVTMSPSNTQDTRHGGAELVRPSGEALGSLIQELVGWELVDSSGAPLGTIQSDGTVQRPDGTSEELVFVQNGSSWVLTLETSGRTGPVTGTSTGQWTAPEISNETTTSGTSVPNPDGTPVLQDSWTEGNVTTSTYLKTDTANRIDTNTWTETSTKTDGKQEITTTRKQTITVSLDGQGRTVIGYWEGVTDNSWTELDMAKPQDSLLSNNSGSTSSSVNASLVDKNLCNDKPNASNTTTQVGKFKYDGYGVASTVLISRYNGSNGNVSAHQFRLVDSNNNTYYVYCADLATTAQPGYNYDMTNVEDANYYQGENATKHIQAIASNGYWGGTDGNGSVNDMQALLTQYRNDPNAPASVRNLNDDDIQALTDGLALSATQAAIWKFGNNDENRYVNDNPIQVFGWVSGKYAENGTHIKRDLDTGGKAGSSDADHPELANSGGKKAANALYDLLVSDFLMNKTSYTATDILQADDVTGASITVMDKVSEADIDHAVKQAVEAAQAKNSTQSYDVYNTDVSFTLAVAPSDLNGDLLVRVYAGEQLVATRRLAGDDTVSQYGAVTRNQDGSYTISNIQLAENISVNLQLEGTQNLNAGVYLYQSAGSQTFVGLATGDSKRHVDLNVGIRFNVTDATQSTASTVTETTSTRTWDEKTTKIEEKESKTDVTETAQTLITVTTEVTYREKVSETVTADTVVWNDSGRQTYTYPDPDPDPGPGPGPGPGPEGDDDDDIIITEEPIPQISGPEELDDSVEIADETVPLANIPSVDEEVEILDEDIPLAAAPATGDISTMWYAAAGLSAAGLVCLALLRRRDED